jgi:uncharacterized surface protein with fasciclin (FAS1) repeats
MKKLLFKSALLVGAFTFLVSCSEDTDDDGTTTTPQSKTIAATVQADARFTVLLDALNRTSLTSVLDDANSSFTVFAPNDAAFGTLLQNLGLADLDAAEAALTTNGLRNLLLYHVLNVEVMSDAVTTGYVSTQGMADMPANGNLSIYTDISSGVKINGIATVRDADIEASNGVIHEIDAVLQPLTVYGLLSLNSSNYSSLGAALGAADGNLVDALDSVSASAVTVFAPDNNAFNGLVQSTPNVNNLTELVTALGTATLRDVLLYHLVDGNNRAESITSGSFNTALMGTSIDVTVGSSVTIVDGKGETATVTATNIQGTNGVVHKINKVLLPQ